MNSQQLSVGLAPMEGVTDFGARLFFAALSQPKSMGTPFLRVTKTYPPRGIPLTYAPEIFTKFPYTLTPQMMASDPADLERTAELVLVQAPFLELNCGCPAPKVVGNGGGSSLLKDPQIFLQTIDRLTSSLGAQRLSVKIRTGFDSSSFFAEIIAGLKDLPIKHLTIHGRTKAQRYAGFADWTLIENAAKTLPYPVIGSGDIVDRQSLAAKQQVSPSVRGIIIGRGAIRNPWIFDEIRTDSSTKISGHALIATLKLFAYLMQLEKQVPAELVDFAAENWGANYCGTSADCLTALNRKLEDFAKTAALKLCPEAIEPKTLGRTKMLWNYLRSSIDGAFIQPRILRAKNFADLLLAVEAFWLEHCHALAAETTLKYNPELDRYYGKGQA